MEYELPEFFFTEGKQYERLNLLMPWNVNKRHDVWICHATCEWYDPCDEIASMAYSFFASEATRDEAFGEWLGTYYDLEKYDRTPFYGIKFTRKRWPWEVLE